MALIFGIAVSAFFLGILVGATIIYYGCDGEIICNDKQLYLNITEKDMEAIEHGCRVISLRVRRK